MPTTKYPELQERAWLHNQYVSRKQAIGDIAALLGCSPANVYLAMQRHGIQARSRKEQRALFKYKPRTCRSCRETFQPTATSQPYCSDCRAPKPGSHPRPRHKCTFCEEFFRLKGKHWTYYSKEFCSADHRLAFLARSGGRADRLFRNKDGYIMFRVGKEYPGANAVGYMGVHRWAMEQRLGRSLFRHEEVHHRNGHRNENDLCANCPAGARPPVIQDGKLLCETCGWYGPKPNLELWTKSQPAGQRVEDKIEWATWFLAQYGYEVRQPAA